MTSSAEPAVARRAVVAGHGEFAAGMISAVQQIAGRGDAFRAVSNRDLSAAALEDVLRATVEANGARVIFTDLPAGSCTIAARRIARDVPALTVVTGTNLTVLLGWVLGAEGSTDGSADGSAASCAHAVERGRGALAMLPAAAEHAEGGGAH